MFNNPLKWHPLHQEVDGSAPEKKSNVKLKNETM